MVQERYLEYNQCIQSQFNKFEWWIRYNMRCIQASDLAGLHQEMAILENAIEEMYMTLFHTYPIIEVILMEDMLDIWVIKKGKNAKKTGGKRSN